MNFRSGGYDYFQDRYGIHQISPEPFKYDANYVSCYNGEKYRRDSERLQALRLGFVIGVHGSIPKTICDVGFGNGAFLMACKGVIPKLYGKDVSGVMLDFVENVWHYPKCDVVTFHDVLEHIEKTDFLHDIPCETIIISLPWCHFSSLEWFDNWKHRKPNEHVHHFSPETLTNLMYKYGWKAVARSNHEDSIRASENCLPNILSMGFKRCK